MRWEAWRAHNAPMTCSSGELLAVGNFIHLVQWRGWQGDTSSNMLAFPSTEHNLIVQTTYDVDRWNNLPLCQQQPQHAHAPVAESNACFLLLMTPSANHGCNLEAQLRCVHLRYSLWVYLLSRGAAEAAARRVGTHKAKSKSHLPLRLFQ